MSRTGPSPTLYDAAVDLPCLTHLTTDSVVEGVSAFQDGVR